MARSTTKKTKATKAKAKPKAKATAKAKPAARKKRAAALSEERTHKLTQTQLMKWRMLFAEMRGRGAQVEASQLRLLEKSRKFDAFVATIPRAAQLQKEVHSEMVDLQALQKGFKEKQAEHTQYVNELREKLGLKGLHIAIDDETGIVREIEEGPG